MKWVKQTEGQRLPVKSWCGDVEEGAVKQAINLANHPVVVKHVALMPDCHQGYGMPIGGVIACDGAVIPNAVGVDIGCGMGAVRTNFPVEKIGADMPLIRALLKAIKARVPVGEGKAHKDFRKWEGFNTYLTELGIGSQTGLPAYGHPSLPGWLTEEVWTLAGKNLGTLGGGNHFLELQRSETGMVWLMLHSGSRNLGYRIANYYHKLAKALNEKWRADIPVADLAFLPVDTEEGKAYLRDMRLALAYARENRRRMMEVFKEEAAGMLEGIVFEEEINIHHNYAAPENHFGANLWIHRKGATSAREGEMGIIPGSMGTASYIVRGRGNREAFMSCSHGAGRNMSRTAACERLSVQECDEAMQGIVFDRWGTFYRKGGKKKLRDLSEAPLAYKDIDEVIEAELDLIEPVVRLLPLGVIKG